MIKVACFLVSLVVIANSTLARPTRATCPAGWWVNGITPAGYFACYLTELTREWPPIDAEPTAVIGSRIYCTGGSHPIVVSARVVGCQR